MSNICENCSQCSAAKREKSFQDFKEKYQAITAFSYSFLECSTPTTMLLSVTDNCNLACQYCFVKQHPNYMTYQIAEDAILWLKSNYEKKKKTNGKMLVNFFGGEPLLCFEDVIKPIVEKWHNEIDFGITTNGILLNEDIVDFFYKYDVQPLLSFDGVKKVQNTQRPGKEVDSFNTVLRNIPYLLIRFPNTVMRATLTKESIPFIFETVQMAENLGFKKITFCPNAYEDWNKEVENNLFDQFNKVGLYVYKELQAGNIPIQVDPITKFYNNINLASKGELFFNNTIFRCGLGTTTCAITPNGNIVPCQEKTSNPSVILGDIYNGIDPNIHKQFLIDYFSKVNNLICNKGCSKREALFCLSDICPSRLEDLNYNFSSASCAYTRIATKVAGKLHYLCANSDKESIRKYFGEDG
jgi:uncharacterized protein